MFGRRLARSFALTLPALLGCAAAHADPPAPGPFAGRTLYVEPESNAARQAEAWRDSDPAGAAVMDELARHPQATWLSGWEPDVRARVDAALDRAGEQVQAFVVYNIPHRDCGAWSAGGAGTADAYRTYVDQVADGLEGRETLVVLEPDGLPLTSCLNEAQEQERFELLSYAVDRLTEGGAHVYLDAGDSAWIPAADMAERLRAAGVERADGVSLNVSHTEFEEDEAAYADELRAILGEQVHYVIDTGRSGRGPTEDSEWCNPLGRALGSVPTLDTNRPGLDATLWIKPPGESDGYCNGGPEAGRWWPEYARDLAVAAGL